MYKSSERSKDEEKTKGSRYRESRYRESRHRDKHDVSHGNLSSSSRNREKSPVRELKPVDRKENNNNVGIQLKPSGLLGRNEKSKKIAASKKENDKYSPPKDSIVPASLSKSFQLFLFKSEDDKDATKIVLSSKSFYIIGKDEEVCDIIVRDSDTVSSQHAVVQFREKSTGNVSAYIIDMDSKNGSFLNEVEIPKERYIELKNQDILRFGESDWEYIFISS
ncbi:hypothetical protein PACTADRAFT_51783 [Pachysolen tannophilus NRRL Y-2460]|uniref:FHA domain-containing protein n=1 Tax=Pachysolen tannophilus NRRL Y-2460 TaxID=669874 RepID=A0A1E4TNB1_PACTA|nr:hypothetical protein PACTADRAFT_51783 [Pachysolen tannophilus NRRL Y-2460]